MRFTKKSAALTTSAIALALAVKGLSDEEARSAIAAAETLLEGLQEVGLVRGPATPKPQPIPTELTATISYLGETRTLAEPMKVGTSLNGVPFVVADTTGSLIALSTPSTLYGTYRVDGAMFDPWIIDNAPQGYNEGWAYLSGAQVAAKMSYGNNAAPNVAGPFAITQGMAGRYVQLITDRTTAPEAPDGGTWAYVKKQVDLNIVPSAPPAGAICPIYTGAGGVQWLTTANCDKNIFKGTGYVPGQTTLEAAVAAIIAHDKNPNFAFWSNNGEQRRVMLPEWFGHYSADFAPLLAKVINACHAVGAAGVPDWLWYWLLTLGAQHIEGAMRGYRTGIGGAGQNNGIWMLMQLVCFATKNPTYEAVTLAYQSNERNQPFWVTAPWIGCATGWEDDVGYGVTPHNHDYNCQTYSEGHLGTVSFRVQTNSLVPADAAASIDSGLSSDYQQTSGKAGVECFAAMLGFVNGRGGMDGSTFMLAGGPNNNTNPAAAALAYWNEYAFYPDEIVSPGSFFATSVNRAQLAKRFAECAEVPVPQPSHPFVVQRNQATYWQAGDGVLTWNYATAITSPLPILRYDNRLSLDNGRTFKELLDCGVSGSTGAVPRGVPIYAQNRLYNSAGTRGWGYNQRRQITRAHSFVLTATGVPTGAPVPDPTAPARIVVRRYPLWQGLDFMEAPASVPAGTRLELGVGWWTSGDMTGGASFRWTVEGVQVSTAQFYVTQPGDASIEGYVTIGGVERKAVTVVNDVLLAFTSPASVAVSENAKLAFQPATTRPATITLRSVAQNGASLDVAQFEFSGGKLRWIGDGTKDFESPQDANADNTYAVVWRAHNAYTGQIADQTVAVSVTDVVEGVETYYDFANGTNGQDLTVAYPAWTRDSSEVRVASNGAGALRRVGTTGSAHFYREGVNTSNVQRAALTFLSSATQPLQLAVFGLWSGGTFSGYSLYANSATTLLVRKWVNGVGTTLATVTVAAAVGVAFELEAVDTGTATELKVYAAGVQQGPTAIDSAGTRRASGYNGIYSEGNSTLSSALADDFRGNTQF